MSNVTLNDRHHILYSFFTGDVSKSKFKEIESRQGLPGASGCEWIRISCKWAKGILLEG